MELHRLLLILDKETLSGNATIQKCLLSDLLQSYKSSSGADEEYIYMNKVLISGTKDNNDKQFDALVNGKATKNVLVPQKSLPDLPPPRAGATGREPFPLPAIPVPACMDFSESYYEEAQPYEETVNDDGEAVSSSYESYDEEEVTREKSLSAQHQWPSAEASIELMKDARICAFLWRKKWLGQWAKQLCVIKDYRLLCYKSSKEQTPLLDVSLQGCSVTYKEKQPRKKHKLKIVPVGGEAIVLGLQSNEQAEQWLKVIQEISLKPAENCDLQHPASELPKLICTKGELYERHSVASESGSSTDSHAEMTEKDVKKKSGAGLMFSNLMNIAKRKPSALESPEKSIDTSGYLNILVNSQWRPCWCLIKNGQLWLYQEKGKNKLSQPVVTLEGCNILPDPSPEHLYSFRIDMGGTQLATLEAKTSADMGNWLGLLLSQTGTKTDPEDLTYDYVNAERISTIISAAKTSFYLMQRRYSETNTYIDTIPSISQDSNELYDDDAEENSEPNREENKVQEVNELTKEPADAEQDRSKIYLDLVPLPSFLHPVSGHKTSPHKETSSASPVHVEEHRDHSSQNKEIVSTSRTEPDPAPALNGPTSTPATSKPEHIQSPTHPQAQLHSQLIKTSSQSQESSKRLSLGVPQALGSPGVQTPKGLTTQTVANLFPNSPQSGRLKAHTIGSSSAVEIKLGKNRTEADMRRYTDERDCLEKEREEVRSSLANLKRVRRETKEELNACQDPKCQVILEVRLKKKEEECREAERRRVEVELRLVEVKESLKKVEAGPFTLGTTLDSSLQDTPVASAASSQTNNTNAEPASPVNSATALKTRPASILATKGKVLQKAKEWEKKSTT
ncbi:actin filament-associated protein 1-like 2 [Nematolebias whitei]|uniref:actin filament-associated protein 1-like 2 n=1 Tax=Nematolebias whitei TaxID=451745 RepID=UPI00189ADBFB|nr:actin filament-associated protein 1-like 2 [Nematolebias whitei]